MPYREGFGPMLEDTSQVEWDSSVALEEEIQRVGAERVAAFVFEPVIGAGGVRVPPPGYLDEAVAVCRAARRARDRRLRDRGLRPAWRLVRRRALPPAARPDHVREGRDERLPPARRRHRRARDGGAVLGRAGSDVRARRHVCGATRPAVRLRSRTSTCSGGTISSIARWRSRRTSMRR